jgi:two-component system LytT family response regulator
MLNKLRTVIVDDEPLARAKLRRFLAAEPDLEIVAEAGDGDSALAKIRDTAPDLVFLDVQMPGKDGFRVLTDLGGDRPPCVIFVTAHDQFAVKAFEFHAIEFLLKPYDRRRFAKAIARARELLRGPDGAGRDRHAARLAGLLAGLAQRNSPSDRIAVKSGRRIDSPTRAWQRAKRYSSGLRTKTRSRE